MTTLIKASEAAQLTLKSERKQSELQEVMEYLNNAITNQAQQGLDYLVLPKSISVSNNSRLNLYYRENFQVTALGENVLRTLEEHNYNVIKEGDVFGRVTYIIIRW